MPVEMLRVRPCADRTPPAAARGRNRWTRGRTVRVPRAMPDPQLSDRRRVAALREMGLLTDTPEELERIRAEYYAHNHGVQALLRERGFGPD